MKIAIPVLFLLLLSCQPHKKTELAGPVNRKTDYVNVHIPNEPPLNIPFDKQMYGPSSPEQARAVQEQHRAMINRLWQVSPIPVPGVSSLSAITPETAHERYVDFVKAYATDSILPLFQQRYARLLLNEYHWLETGRADVISYYVDQLIVSQSRDIETIAKGVVALSGKLPPSRFVLLRNRALPLLEEQLALEQNRLSALIRRVEHTRILPGGPAKRPPAALTTAQRELPKVRQQYMRDSSSLARLRLLRLG